VPYRQPIIAEINQVVSLNLFVAQNVAQLFLLAVTHLFKRAVAVLVYLKSADSKKSCRFDSGLGHQSIDFRHP